MKKRKIKLIIFPGNFLPHIGGLETHVDEFTKFLSKDSKYEITIFSPNVVKAKDYETIHNNVKVIRYPAFEFVHNWPFPKFWSLKFYKMFFRLYKSDFDIVMTRTRFFANSTLGLKFAKFRFKRIKLIHVEHGSDFVKLESKFKSFVSYVYDMTFGLILFKFSDGVVVISDAVRKFVRKEFLPRRNLYLIRRGIDIQKIDIAKPDFKLKRQFQDKIIISFVGRLYKWKGVANSLKAYKMLPEPVKKKSVLVIGGYGEEYDRLENLAGNDLNKRIFLLGKLPFERTYQLMKLSDIHIHSAYQGGGLSSTLMQYMYTKNAVVASPHEGAREIIFNNKTGILLKNNSPKELLRGLAILIRSKKIREKYSLEAHNLIKKQYKWDDVIGKYEKLFDEILE